MNYDDLVRGGQGREVRDLLTAAVICAVCGVLAAALWLLLA